MTNNPFDAIQSRVGDFLGSKGLSGLENPITQLIRQSLQDMEFVTLEDLDIQKEVIQRLRERVHALEQRVEALEKRGS